MYSARRGAAELSSSRYSPEVVAVPAHAAIPGDLVFRDSMRGGGWRKHDSGDGWAEMYACHGRSGYWVYKLLLCMVLLCVEGSVELTDLCNIGY